jgi:uncharacterized protein (UPF0332 family)
VLALAAEYLAKAEESLAGAESEHAAGRYNNCANRCYYAAFQAAIAALIRAGVAPRGTRTEWGHDFVQAEFARLIARRKLYSAEHRSTLTVLMNLREQADYRPNRVSVREASQVLRATRQFVAMMHEAGGDAR